MSGKGASPLVSNLGYTSPIPTTPGIAFGLGDGASDDVFNDWVFAATTGAFSASQTEAATGSDTTSCLIGYAPAATEAGSASDAASAAMAAVVAIIEAASAADSVNGTASGDYTATITEAVTASSLEAAVSNYLAAISESASASDSASASLPGEYSVSISEAASAIETAVCAMSALVTINEAAAAADVANWVGAITFTRAPRGGGYPGTPPITTRPGQTNTARPKMANTRR